MLNSSEIPDDYVSPREYLWNSSLKRVGRVVIAAQSICPSLERLQNGDLLISLYSLTFWKGKVVHCVKLKRSKDGGLTWSEPVLIAGPPKFEAAHSHLGMTQLSNGTILLPFNKEEPGRKIGMVGSGGLSSWLIKSEDNGYSWKEPIKIAPNGVAPDVGLELSVCYGKIREFENGEVILPVWVFKNGEQINGYFRSLDWGESWDKFIYVAKAPFGGDETDYIKLPNGKLLAVMRVFSHEEHGMAPLYWCYSEDGERWSEPKPAWNMYGHSPCLFLTKKGQLICGYRYVGDLDTGIVGTSFSHGQWDESSNSIKWSFPNHIWLGSTWGLMAAYKVNRCGYPSFAYADSNRILCVHWVTWSIKSSGGRDTPIRHVNYARDVEGVFFSEE